jgi:hypothetical protein
LSEIRTTYSSILWSASPTFVRPNGNSGRYYYYEAINVNTYTSGTYAFKSSSDIDTYGCLYQGSFNPLYPIRNMIACDDDSGGDRQFQITSGLLNAQAYILVVTTYSASITGSYQVTAVGPATVYMSSVTPSTTSSRYPTRITAICE